MRGLPTHKMLLQRITDLIQTKIELQQTVDTQLKQLREQEVLLHELADNLGNALYSDEWRTREYGIAAFSGYQRTYPEYVIDVDERRKL